MKRFFCYFLFLLIFVPSESAHAAVFSDVVVDHPNYQAIEYVKMKGYMKGYDDGTFRPGVALNRAELLKVAFVGAEGENGSADAVDSGEQPETDNLPPSPCFIDVPSDAWFQPYVCGAKEQGIVSGFEDNTFKPGQRVTVAETAKILAKTYDLETAEGGDFWHSPFLRALGAERALPATFKFFNQDVTRGEAAEMLWRLGEDGASENDTDLQVANVDRLEENRCESSPENIPPGIDMARVRQTWLDWNNEARTAAGLHAYTYNDQLGRTAAVWSEQAEAVGSITHKRAGQSAYYDYYRMIAWFKDLGLTFKNIGGVTMVENIGWEYYKCSDDECTDEIIAAIRKTFNFFIGEKGKAYTAHYDSIMNPNFKELGIGLALDESRHKYYLTVHYATEITSNPAPVCPVTF